jgi:hypothetical protein
VKGLLVQTPWVDLILDGVKTWELRGSRTSVRGPIALIRSGSKTIVGTCELVDVLGPLSKSELLRTVEFHAVPVERLAAGSRYARTYAWVLRNPVRLARPVPYRHPPGAVIWVNLPDTRTSGFERRGRSSRV